MKNTSWAFTYLSRFLALLGFFLASPVFAACPAPNTYTEAEGCSGQYGPGKVWVFSDVVESGSSCDFYYTCLPTNPRTLLYSAPKLAPTPSPTPEPCSTSFGSSGAAATGYCISDNKDPPTCLKFKGHSYEQWGNSLPTFTCVNSCEYSILPDSQADQYVFQPGQPLVNGWTQVGFSYKTKGTGSSCNSPPFDPNKPPPNLPPIPPQSCGEVNGQTVCFDQKPPTGTDGVDIKEETKSNSDGSKTETKTDTTCVGNTCQTTKTETTKDASGNSTGSTTTTTTENKESYCSKNPQSTQCKGDDFCQTNADLSICKEGKWSETSCDSAPACSGDAVQCAQAANAFKTYCESKKTADALYGTGQGLGEAQSSLDAAIAFGSGTASLIPNIQTVEVGALNTTNPWGASCLADTEVAQFEGHSITIPFSKYCSVFELMGRIAVAVTLLGAGLYVFKD